MSFIAYVFCRSLIVSFLCFTTPVFACLKFGFGMGYFAAILISLVSGLILTFFSFFCITITGVFIPAVAILLCIVVLMFKGEIIWGCISNGLLLLHEILQMRLLIFSHSDPETDYAYNHRYCRFIERTIFRGSISD